MNKEYNELEYNKLCAEFTGRCGKLQNNLYWTNVPNTGWLKLDCLYFHSDWNWIHYLIERIELIGYQVDFGSRLLPSGTSKDHFCIIWDDNHKVKVTENFSDTNKKEAVVQAIWLFLLWYNENKEA